MESLWASHTPNTKLSVFREHREQMTYHKETTEAEAGMLSQNVLKLKGKGKGTRNQKHLLLLLSLSGRRTE
jgi:hypothetical protein